MEPETYSYRGTPFSIKYCNQPSKPGCWDIVNVEVFFDGNPIGSYTRTYPSFAKETFYPFKQRGEWYVLYSADYTAARVARVTEGKFVDWCGEDASAFGFCPVEFYVPRYKTTSYAHPDGKPYTVEMFDNEYYGDEEMEEYYFMGENEGEGEKYLGETYCEYGFLSGCIWGDDSSMKLRFIDLSNVESKELKVEEKFGYFELPGSLTLKECSRNYEVDVFELTQLRRFNLSSNKLF
jgi:hypothetical protein